MQGTWSFPADNAALKVGGSWVISRLLQVDFTWDVAPIPTRKAKWWTIGEASGISTPKGARHPDESWDLNLLMTGPEGQASGFPAGELPPKPMRSKPMRRARGIRRIGRRRITLQRRSRRG